MSSNVKAVSAAKLKLGMYVSRLDRPWLETPFLFQGFYIRCLEDIDELKRFCDHVYIDVERSDYVPKQPLRRGPRRKRASRWRRLLNRLFPAEPAPAIEAESAKETCSLRQELPDATKAHDQAKEVVADVMTRVREGGKLDLLVIEQVVDPMIQSVLRNPDALAWLARMRKADNYLYTHSVGCSVYAIVFGRHLGLPEHDLQVLGLGAMLLDVGKVRIPAELLTKTEELEPTEWALLQRHVEYGLEILSGLSGLDPRITEMVRSHHERYDGSGYPNRLRGSQIAVFARIAGIVDYYDAMITARPHAPAVSTFDAMRELHNSADREFQAEMVNQFIQAIGVFPNGTLVELNTGEVAIVLEQNRVRRLRPKLMLILNSAKKPLKEMEIMDLRERPSEPGIKDAVWIARGLEPGAHGVNPAEYFL